MSSDEEDAALRARLERLDSELGAVRKKRPVEKAAPTPGSTSASGAAMTLALRLGSEIVAGVVVGGAIGLGLDWLLRTKPAFTILFFLLGVTAGIWNVVRAVTPKERK